MGGRDDYAGIGDRKKFSGRYDLRQVRQIRQPCSFPASELRQGFVRKGNIKCEGGPFLGWERGAKTPPYDQNRSNSAAVIKPQWAGY